MWIKALMKLKEDTENKRKAIDKKHEIVETQGSAAERATRAAQKREQMNTAEFQTIDLGLEK